MFFFFFLPRGASVLRACLPLWKYLILSGWTCTRLIIGFTEDQKAYGIYLDGNQELYDNTSIFISIHILRFLHFNSAKLGIKPFST